MKKKSKQNISCVYPPLGKFLGGITKPKPFIYLDELDSVLRKEVANCKKDSGYHPLEFNAGRSLQIWRFYKAAAKIAKGRK